MGETSAKVPDKLLKRLIGNLRRGPQGLPASPVLVIKTNDLINIPAAFAHVSL